MRTFSGKPQVLKEINSSMIEQLVFENGPISKPELARRTGLSLPTISKLVDDLEKNSRLCPAGRSGKGAGRKAILYETNRNSGCLLACYYKQGSYICRLADMMNNTLYENSFPMNSGSSKKALASTLGAIDDLMKRAPAQVKIIGIGLPGVIQPDGYLMAIPQIAVWEGFNLEKALANRYKAAIYVENDVKLSTMGYYYTHLTEKHENLVYLYVGNGIGSGIILNRQLYRGTGHFSGEIGFMAESAGAVPRNYSVNGGFLESRVGAFVDFGKGELKRGNNASSRRELIAIFSSIAVNHVAVLNPGVIVFAGKIFDKALVDDIVKHMSNYLPPGIMPRITRDTSSSSGLEGLVKSCREYITTGVHLVQGMGLPQRVDRFAV